MTGDVAVILVLIGIAIGGHLTHLLRARREQQREQQLTATITELEGQLTLAMLVIDNQHR